MVSVGSRERHGDVALCLVTGLQEQGVQIDLARCVRAVLQDGQLATIGAFLDGPNAHALALGVLFQAFADAIAKGVIKRQLAYIAGDADRFDSSSHDESFLGGSNTRGGLL